MGSIVMTEIKVDNIVDLAGTGKPNFPVAPTHSTGSALNTLNTYQYDTTTRVVTVVDDGGNKFAIDGVTAPTITLFRGVTYTFDVSDSSVSTHPLAFKNGGVSYTTGVTSTGTAGTAGATVTFAVDAAAPLTGLTYYCTTHGDGMGSSVTTSDPTNGTLLWDGAVKFYADSSFRDVTPSGGSGGGGSSSSSPHGDRVVYHGGNKDGGGGYTNEIEYLSIPTPGNAADFGDLTLAPYESVGGGNGTTAINFSGRTTSDSFGYNGIDYWAYATTGNATNFGNPHTPGQSAASAWNTNRVLIAGGNAPNSNPVSPISYKVKDIQYVAIATTAMAAYNGDLGFYKSGHSATADATRAVFAGGNATNETTNLYQVDNMEYVTIDTTGNAADFGDLLEENSDSSIGVVSDGTKGYFCGYVALGSATTGGYTGRYRDIIQTITIQTLGNATDFGDLTAVIGYANQAGSSTHGVVMGGVVGGNGTGTGDFKRIDKFTLVTASTATDFGDLSVNKSRAGCSSGAAS
tara:strand:+ start:5789 stop:7339 length:1551 start_codon:yes stop_codon:yes gene_type:complete